MAKIVLQSFSIIGKHHIQLSRINSTNKYATDMIAKSKPIEGTVISAHYQYEGRGQIGRFWESEAKKNILCSVILYPKFLSARNQFYLNIAISLAIYDFISFYIDEKISIKWPNDIYVGEKKIAGILIQNTLVGKTIRSSIIGLGVNINQDAFDSNIPNPTSLLLENNKTYNIDILNKKLFDCLNQRYFDLKNNHELLKKEYLSHLYRKGVKSDFILENEQIFKGVITDIDDIGQLIITNLEGEKLFFGYREIRFVID
ncbi:MAG: biotin--[acetyl-CoA-carboxylase] ligase [Saprospiraceae bacterium]